MSGNLINALEPQNDTAKSFLECFHTNHWPHSSSYWKADTYNQDR